MTTTDEKPSPQQVLAFALGQPAVKTKLIFLIASFLSLALSVGLWFSGNELQGVFVGLWVPSILSAGALLMAGESTTTQ
jgi:hypothetical protein